MATNYQKLSFLILSFFSLITVAYGTLPTSKINGKYYLSQWGTSSVINTAVTDLNNISENPEVVLVIDISDSLSSNLTVDKELQLEFIVGNAITLPSTYILTVYGSIKSDCSQIFNVTGATAKVTLGEGSVKEIVPQWWGAKADGSTDDYAALQAAFDAAKASRTNIHIPRGTYCIETALMLDLQTYASNRAIHVSSDWATIKANATMDQCMTIKTGSHITVERIIFDANGLADIALKTDHITERKSIFRQIVAKNALDYGFYVDTCQVATFENCAAQQNYGEGWRIIASNAASFISCQATSNESHGFHIQSSANGSGGCFISGIWSESNEGHGLWIDTTSSPVIVKDGWLEQNDDDGVYITGATGQITSVVLSGLGIIGCSNASADNYAIHLDENSRGVHISGCFIQHSATDNYDCLKVDMLSTDSNAATLVLDNNFKRYNGLLVTPVFD